MREIQFDDVTALQQEISPEFGAWGPPVEISQDMIQKFADLTGDQQWIHVDLERCRKESPFRQPIAHGFLTLSLIPQLRPGSAFRIVGFGNATNYGADRLRFTAPVPSGSQIHARSRLVGVETKAAGTQVTTEVQVSVVGKDRPCLVYVMLVLYHPVTASR